MKICEIDDDIYKIFLNDLEIKNINVASEKSLESTIRGVILRLKSKYDIVLKGLYDVSIFIKEGVSAYIIIEKVNTFLFREKDIDLRIKIIFNSKFYFKTFDYDVVKAFNDVYFYNNEYYTEVSNLEDINKYIDFGDIIYDDTLNIEHLGLKINKNSIKI